MAEYPHACNGTISTFYNFLSTFYDIPSTKMTLLKVHDILATFFVISSKFPYSNCPSSFSRCFKNPRFTCKHIYLSLEVWNLACRSSRAGFIVLKLQAGYSQTYQTTSIISADNKGVQGVNYRLDTHKHTRLHPSYLQTTRVYRG